jgi:hypothetical protein
MRRAVRRAVASSQGEVFAMRVQTMTTSVITFLVVASAASATPTASLQDPPAGPGTEIQPSRVGDEYRVREGAEAGAQLGGGFGHPYGVGMGARLGYTFAPGVYLGGAYTHYFGSTTASHADFFGAEAGYKFFPTARWELRPFAFIGPAFIDTGAGPARANMAFQPSLLTGYHFGSTFLSAEARGLVAPDPAAFALLGGVGFGL